MLKGGSAQAPMIGFRPKWCQGHRIEHFLQPEDPLVHRRSRARVKAMVGAAIVFAWSGVQAQKAGPADLAASLTGTWKLNRELSDSMAGPGRGGRRGGGASFAVAAPVLQRGG